MHITNDPNKLEQFNEFFSIDFDFNVNICKTLSANELPSFEQFIEQIPLPFKMATEVMTIDQAALRPIQGLSGVASQLVEFLNYQSQKIELLVGYILSQQDDEQHRYQGIKFGGGGIVFNAPTAFAVDKMIEMKIFLLHANCAIYCLGEIIKVEQTGDNYSHQVIFHYLREEDREILVRTSLHEQSKQLKKLAKQRNLASKNKD
jgi:hypothetical protein